MFEQHQWKSDILSKDLLKMSLSHKCFASKNQLSDF